VLNETNVMTRNRHYHSAVWQEDAEPAQFHAKLGGPSLVAAVVVGHAQATLAQFYEAIQAFGGRPARHHVVADGAHGMREQEQDRRRVALQIAHDVPAMALKCSFASM